MAADKITTTMQSALDYIRQEGGGAVERRAGGFWMKSSVKSFRSGMAYVKTATINALEQRGLVECSGSRATLTQAGINATNWTPTNGEDAAACGVGAVDGGKAG